MPTATHKYVYTYSHVRQIQHMTYIQVWSPFVHYGVRSHHAVGVVGLGGLGACVRGRLCSMDCPIDRSAQPVVTT